MSLTIYPPPATGTVSDVSSANGAITVATGTSTPVLTAVYAPALKSATTTVDVSAATAPSSGQVLTATGASAATWQTPGGGISGLTTGQNVVAASATTIATDGYKRYEATLTQTSTNAPVATVGQNGTGTTMTWARSDVGTYTVTAGVATFTANKTQVFIGALKPAGGEGIFNVVDYVRTSTTVLTFQLQQADSGSGAFTDGLLTETAITVIVFP